MKKTISKVVVLSLAVLLLLSMVSFVKANELSANIGSASVKELEDNKVEEKRMPSTHFVVTENTKDELDIPQEGNSQEVDKKEVEPSVDVTVETPEVEEKHEEPKVENIPEVEIPKAEVQQNANELPSIEEKTTAPEVHVHTFSPWKVELEATCRTTGKKTRQCTECNEVETEVIGINLNAHKYIELPDEEATCERSGKTNYKVCELCGNNTFRLVLPLGHKWADEYTVVQEATCQKDGYKYHRCTREGCSATDTPVITKATGHKYEDVITEATCTEYGSKSKKCSVCGHEKNKQNTVAPKGHEYSEYEIYEEATCTHDATKKATCIHCGHEDIIVKENTKLEHEFVITLDDGVLPTCEADGREASKKCKNCDQIIKGKVINALGHQFVAMVLPGETSKETIKCIRCHMDFDDAKITFGTGHKWTVDEEGHDICECDDPNCNHEDSTWWKLWKRNEDGDREACIWFVGFTCNTGSCEGFTDHGSQYKVDTVLEGRRGSEETMTMEAPKAREGWEFDGWYEVTADGQGKRVETIPSENGTYVNGDKITVGWKDMDKGFEARYKKVGA